MKVLRLLHLVMLATAGTVAAAPPAVTIQSLLDEMVSFDSVARWPSPEYTCRQASSYDRSEIAPDQPGWFGNADNSQFIRDEERDGHREHVMLDAEGPGAVVRFWLTTDEHREGVLRIYFDGATAPALEIPGFDLMAFPLALESPLLAPHPNYAPGKPGGNTLYLPLPYAKHCKITWEERAPGKMPPRYYQINYRTYAPGTPVETCSLAQLEAARPAIDRANATLPEPQIFTAGHEVHFAGTLAAASERPIDLPPGPSAVRVLTAKISASPEDLEAALRGLIVRATFDGEETVWCPCSDFFGCGVGANEVRSWYRTVAADGTMTCRWVMPYEKAAHLTIANVGAKPVSVALTARVGEWKWDDRSMHFHANWRQECGLSTAQPRDWRFLCATGRGVLVGDTLAVFNDSRAWYGEGDEKIRVDGEALPSHLGTGTEDYYNASWAPVFIYHTPWASAVRVDHPSSVGHNTFTRTRNLDAIPFAHALDFDMEIIHWRNDAHVNFAAATYWYAFPGAKAAAPPSPEEAARPIAKANLPTKIAGAIECETLLVTAKTDGLVVGPQEMSPFGDGWSNSSQLLGAAHKAGDFVEVRIPAEAPKKLTLYATKAVDYGILRLSVNGKTALEFDGYADKVLPSGPLELGSFQPRDGAFTLRAEVIGANVAAKGVKYLIGLDCVVLSDAVAPVIQADELGHEPFRPQFHFTPERNWMNDPNGMVFYEGEWHLFYQYNPQGDKWGHMSWGHAVSRDLVHWEHLPLALAEGDGVMIFSGSAVVDWKNTSGFGKDGRPPLVAIYTGHREGRQDERLAFSNDRGRTWTKFPGNPVLDIGAADFRDPKVFWHEPTQRWSMVVALSTEKKVRFFASADLKHWTSLSDFGPAGATEGSWECPDLFPLPVEGEPIGNSKWVLVVNINPGGPAGGSGSQYFIGDFDGGKFTTDALPGASTGKILADFEGADYAGWTVGGAAFGKHPAKPDAKTVTGFVGNGIADSIGSGDRDQGALMSPAFTIEADALSFRIGGGAHPGELGIRLLVDGKAVREATGTGSAQMESRTWDIHEWRGKTANVEIFDRYSGDDWGHILVDQVVLGNAPAASALWADYGADFYAGVSWSDVPKSDGRRVWLGWMSNWRYAQDVPTSPWRSAMTVPRALSLRSTPAGLRLVQQPVAELLKLRQPAPRQFPGGTFAAATAWLSAQTNLPALLDMELTFTGITAKSAFSIRLHTGKNDFTTIGCDAAQARLSVDRTHSGQTGFHHDFPARCDAPLRIADGRCTLRLLVDTSSLEVFAQDGETVLTDLIFPTTGPRSLSLQGDGDGPTVAGIAIHTLKSAR